MTQAQTTDIDNPLSNAPCHATIACSDIDNVRDFYTDTLGLTVVQDNGEQGVLFDCGGGTRLYVYPRPGFTPPENTVCSFTVPDIGAVVNALRDNGVTFEEYDLPDIKTENGIASMGDLQSAWFKDPDGNILAVSTM